MSVADKIIDMGFEDVIVFSEPSYDTAFIGVSQDGRAVYDFDEMVRFLIDTDNMSEEEATDFISYNCGYLGDKYPIIVYRAWD